MVKMIDETERVAAGMLRALQRLLHYHPGGMTVLQAVYLFSIAKNQGISQRKLYDELGGNDSSASRILAILSDVGDRNTPGMDLVTLRTNPNDRRERQIFLTKKGEQLMEDIERDLARAN